jgi:hypothetical protein
MIDRFRLGGSIRNKTDLDYYDLALQFEHGRPALETPRNYKERDTPLQNSSAPNNAQRQCDQPKRAESNATSPHAV